jgi:hypothetical protein
LAKGLGLVVYRRARRGEMLKLAGQARHHGL